MGISDRSASSDTSRHARPHHVAVSEGDAVAGLIFERRAALSTSRPVLILRHLRNSGLSNVASIAALKLSRRVGARLNWRDLGLPLRREDIIDSETLAPTEAPARTGLLRIGWVCTAPGPGSGGHTTLFRAVRALEDRGHACTLFLYDQNTDDVSRHVHTIRKFWPELAADIRSATPRIDGMDAVVASSWATAHVVAARVRGPARKFYFIQDYEPYFYPRGDLYALAEDTYRFGFTNIALGSMVADRLFVEAGVAADVVVPFGCDTEVYHLINDSPGADRSGVVFYARPDTDRRGYILGKLALEEFHLMHPEQAIHVVSTPATGWRVPVINHGNVSPRELNKLFNRSIAGIAMSFTNVSLMAEEMLAAGCIPVINDSPLCRADLASPYALWARPTPYGVASALSKAIQQQDLHAVAEGAAGSVTSGWSETKKRIAREIEKACAA